LPTKNAKNSSEPGPKEGQTWRQINSTAACGLPREIIDFKAGQNRDKGQRHI
jgi:hypothetical protein